MLMTSILIADDSSELRLALRLLLQTRLGVAEIYEAQDMEHVLAIVEDASPDLLMLDWELPGRPTRERISVLRTLTPQMKVIALSARPEAEQEAVLEAVDAFISKVISPEDMLGIIEKVGHPRK